MAAIGDKIFRLWGRLKGSLRARILIPTAVLFSATLAGTVLAALQLHGIDMEEAATNRARLFADLVAHGVTKSMEEAGPNGPPHVLGNIDPHETGIEVVSILRADGTVAFSTDDTLYGTRAWIGPLEQREVVTSGDQGELVVLRPIPNRATCVQCHGAVSKVNGWLDVRFSRRQVQEGKMRLLKNLTWAAIPSLVALLAIAWWLIGREAIAPLHRLVAAMHRAERGQEAKADEGRPDEIGVAARGFDATLAALRKSQAELEVIYRERMVRADRFAAVGEMASGLAHEIKNPLAGLSGALELLAEDLAASPQNSEVVAEMRHQVSRLTHTMEGLLSFARPPKPQLASVDVNATLEKVLFLLEQQAKGRPVTVRRDLVEGLPTVNADAGQLEQVFLNIGLNAVQAMNALGGTLTVATSAREGRVSIELRDTGPGIPPEVRPHVFKPFYTTRANGNGLGLAICERLVNEHGGTIRFICPPEGGTIFTVSLPAEPAAVGEEEAA